MYTYTRAEASLKVAEKGGEGGEERRGGGGEGGGRGGTKGIQKVSDIVHFQKGLEVSDIGKC